MDRNALLLVLLSIASSTPAQTWCPPGATWTFEHDDTFGGRVGYNLVEYAGDTMLGGVVAQRLQISIHEYSYPQQQYFHYPFGALYTTVSGDLVQLWDQFDHVFDTLFRFDAVPGDHWLVPNDEGGMPQLIVLDTLHTTVDGMSLRQLVIGTDGSSPYFPDTLTERIGFGKLFIDPVWSFLLDNPTRRLRCYSDDAISYTIPSWTYGCASLLGIADLDGHDRVVLFPDPGSDRFEVALPDRVANATLWLFDATGREVLRAGVSDDRPDVSTSALDPGLFTYRLLDPGGAPVAEGKWVKE